MEISFGLWPFKKVTIMIFVLPGRKTLQQAKKY